MTYLTLDSIKHQCRVDDIYKDDDALLSSYGDAAESFLEGHLNNQLDNIAADNSGELPPALYQALLMLVDYFYGMSGSGEKHDVPQAFWVLTNPWKTYSIA